MLLNQVHQNTDNQPPKRLGHLERKDNADWVKRCMMMETYGTRQMKLVRL